jgi:hypothetical protein
MIREVPISLLKPLWSAIEPHLKAALEAHPFLDVEGVLQRVLAGLAYVMIVLDGDRVTGVVVMEIQQFPKCRIGNVLALGGDKGSMAPFADEVETFLIEWCRAHSLASLGMLGWPGWSKVLNRRGWRTQLMCAAWLPLQD